MREDNWQEKFREKAGPRLRTIFERELNGLPKCIVDKIEELRRKEQEIMGRKEKLDRRVR